MVVLKTSEGRICGGFSPVSWAKAGRGDEKNTFLFSVDYKSKFYKQKENSMRLTLLPMFPHLEIALSD